MSKRLLHELEELVGANVISTEIADRIRSHYQKEESDSGSRLFTIFGILGALLIGLGTILIVANKWEELSKSWQIIAAFLPMLIGQFFCGYALWKNWDSRTWREGSATFLVLSMGATISLISQIYFMPADLSPYMLIWSLLTLPLVYIMRSSAASILYIIGITIYAASSGYGTPGAMTSFWYWILILGIVPWYVWIYNKQPNDNFTIIHHWFLPLSLIICLGTMGADHAEWLFVAYMSLFSVFYLVGDRFFEGKSLISNGFKMISIFGMILILVILSFDEFWGELIDMDYSFAELLSSSDFLVAVFISLLALILALIHLKGTSIKATKLPAIVFVLFLPTFVIGYIYQSVPVIICNVLLLVYGISNIRLGVEKDHLGILNFGLLVIAILIVSRFFDDRIAFAIRGILFLILGLSFFIVNYWLLRNRKKDAIE